MAVWGEFSDDLHLRVEGLLAAAACVGISPHRNLEVEEIGIEKFVGTTVDLERVRQIERVARADVSHYGVGNLDRVCAEIPTIARAIIADHLRVSPHCLWDSADSVIFYLPTARNTLLSRLRRILAMISPVTAEVARVQILRDQRMEGSEFSPAMLLRIAQAQTWCRVTDDEISKADGFEADGFEADGEDSNESKVVALLRQHGPVMDSRIREAACREFLVRLRWPGGFQCPRCDGRKGWPVRGVLLQCSGCGHQTSVTAGTIFQDTRKPLTMWFRAMWAVASQKNGASAIGLQRELGLGNRILSDQALRAMATRRPETARELIGGDAGLTLHSSFETRIGNLRAQYRQGTSWAQQSSKNLQPSVLLLVFVRA